MKFKKLTNSQIQISIDRLTRFKPTEEKYLRVFKDILISNLIEPKYKKNELNNLDYETLRNLTEEIFNSSLEEDNNDLYINAYLKEYENIIFNNNEQVQKLLDNKINFVSALKCTDKNIPENLEWLQNIKPNTEIKKEREEKGFLFPIEKIIIVEGITEEILLPIFAERYGYDFSKNGVKIIPAGGKNQVVKLYYQLYEVLKLPIFILLDNDAEENQELINKHLRKQDKVYLLQNGEFEDILPRKLIIKTINDEFKNFTKITEKELFNKKEKTVKILEEFYKLKGLHEYKKADFAQQLKSQIKTKNDLSTEISDIIEHIKNI